MRRHPTALRCSAICALVALAIVPAGCGKPSTLVAPHPGLERMVEQPRVEAYGGGLVPADVAAMRAPPDRTVAREDLPVDSPLLRSGGAGGYATEAPLTIDLAALQRGQQRYAIVCAACHGLRGDGESPVAQAMALVKPRDLLVEPYRSYPLGRIFAVIRDGYGLMPAQAGLLDAGDAWAVAAYVQVLQLAQAVPIASLSAARRAQLQAQLP